MSETEVVRRRDTTFSSHVFYCSITEKISRYGRMSSISNRHFFYCSALFNRQKKFLPIFTSFTGFDEFLFEDGGFIITFLGPQRYQ
ncbi:uncharacterized protein isoform X2 [Bombus fervidus]|uniref:uncharacterized protein isoform X2 n=1 Tax=Bombus fervidus TaxID=203811 RepID=UPI003D18F4B0